MRRSPLLALLLTTACATVPPPPPPPAELRGRCAQKPEAARYPQTRRQDLVEKQFGVAGRRSLSLARERRPQRRRGAGLGRRAERGHQPVPGDAPAAAKRSRRASPQLYDYERFGVPRRRAAAISTRHNSGLQNQSVLFVRDSLDGEGRVLIDPNTWSADGATALAEWAPSEDGKHARSIRSRTAGTDWRTIKVLDVATGKDTGDEVKWVKFSALEWAKDGSGFFYTRFPEPAAGQDFQSTNHERKDLFPQARNAAVGRPAGLSRRPTSRPTAIMRASATTAAGWSSPPPSGTDDRYEVHAIDLRARGAKPQGADHRPRRTTGASSATRARRFFFMTNKDAPKLKVVAMEVGRPGNPRDDASPRSVRRRSTARRSSAASWSPSYLADAKPRSASTISRARS